METNNLSLQDKLMEGINLADRLGMSDKARGLRAVLSRLDITTIRILLIGDFGRGKSSLLNGLLGDRFLMVSPLPTPTVNLIHWAERASARAGKKGKLSTVPVESLATNDYDYVELGYPLDLLRDMVEFTEMPGMPEASDDTALTETIENSDLILLVLACDALYSASEGRLVEKIKAAGHRDIFFVCNFIDRVPENEIEVLQRSAYTRIPASSNRIFFTSPIQALNGNSEAQAAIKEVSNTIQAAISETRTVIKSQRATNLLRETVATAQKQSKERQLDAERASSQADQRAKAIHEAYEGVMASGRQIVADLDDFQARTRDILQQMTASFIRELSFKVEGWSHDFRGEDRSSYLDRQIKQDVDAWRQNVLSNYLQDNIGRQRESLIGNVGRYHDNLTSLAYLIPHISDDFQFDVILNIPEPQDFNVKSRSNLPNGNKLQRQQVSWTQMPDVILVAGASVATMVLLRPRFIGVSAGLAGLAVAAIIAGSRRTRMSSPLDRESIGRAYATDIRMQADSIGQSVWRSVNGSLEEARKQIEEAIQTQTKQIQQAVQAELAQLQTNATNDDLITSQIKSLDSFLSR